MGIDPLQDSVDWSLGQMHYKNVCRRDNTLSISNMRVGKRQRWAEVGCSVYSSIRGNGGWEERETLKPG